MSTWQVTHRTTGEVVYAYTADEPVEWPGMEYATHNHLLQVPEAEPETTDADWRIYVGAFFDRFGDQKINILSSEDVVVQALIKDASVRQYIGLRERRDERGELRIHGADDADPVIRHGDIPFRRRGRGRAGFCPP